METLNLNLSLEGIIVISKSKFKMRVKQAITEKAFSYLVSQQASHSKNFNLNNLCDRDQVMKEEVKGEVADKDKGAP